MKVASYNIKNDGPTVDLLDNWTYRKKKFDKILRSRSWDIIGLQEVTETQKDYFLSLTEYTFIGDIRDSETGSEYNPILYKRDTFDLIDSKTSWLSKTPNVESRDWEAACTRIFTWAKLVEKETRKEILFISTHFDHISEMARSKSSELLIKFINSMQVQNVVLVGDFNAGPEEYYYKAITARLNDARQKVEYYVGPDVTCTGRDFCHNIKWDDMQSIDYIFTSNDVLLSRLEIVTDRIEGRYPSDHFAVECELELGD